MNTNRYMTLSLIAVIFGLLCAISVQAETTPVSPLAKYQNLHSVSMRKSNSLKSDRSLERLSSRESRYSEELPMQLSGAMKRVAERKYEKEMN